MLKCLNVSVKLIIPIWGNLDLIFDRVQRPGTQPQARRLNWRLAISTSPCPNTHHYHVTQTINGSSTAILNVVSSGAHAAIPWLTRENNWRRPTIDIGRDTGTDTQLTRAYVPYFVQHQLLCEEYESNANVPIAVLRSAIPPPSQAETICFNCCSISYCARSTTHLPRLQPLEKVTQTSQLSPFLPSLPPPNLYLFAASVPHPFLDIAKCLVCNLKLQIVGSARVHQVSSAAQCSPARILHWLWQYFTDSGQDGQGGIFGEKLL